MTTGSLGGRLGGFSTDQGRTPVIERYQQVWKYRRIMRLLIARDLKVRYVGSALGYLWSVLDPLLMSLVYWFVFTQIFTRDVGYTPYIVFLLLGQLPWSWFNGGVAATARALRSEAQMVQSTNVPRELWVIRTVLSKGVEYVLSLPVAAAFAAAYLMKPDIQILLMPLAMLMQVTLLIGLGLILAPLTVLVRDVERVIPIVLRVGFYTSPVLYSVKNIPNHLHLVYSMNPMAGILVLYRAAFFPQEMRWNYVEHSAIACVAILALGIYIFGRLERQVLKEI